MRRLSDAMRREHGESRLGIETFRDGSIGFAGGDSGADTHAQDSDGEDSDE